MGIFASIDAQPLNILFLNKRFILIIFWPELKIVLFVCSQDTKGEIRVTGSYICFSLLAYNQPPSVISCHRLIWNNTKHVDFFEIAKIFLIDPIL